MKSLYLGFLFSILISNSALSQIEKIRQLQQNLSSTRDSMRYVDALNRIALLFYEQSVDSTLHYSAIARQISVRMQYGQGMADATNNLGVVFDIKGNTQLALRYYNDAYNQYVNLKDSSNIMQMLMNVAMVYNIMGKDDKALVHFDRALKLGNESSRDSITGLVIYNYVLLYPESFDAETKKELIQTVQRSARKYGDVRLEVAIQQVIADDMIAGRQQEAGMALLEKTLTEALSRQLYYLSMDILIDLGNNYFKTDTEKGIRYYERALAVAEEKQYRSYARDAAQKLYDVFLARNDQQRAFVYSRKLLKLYEDQAEIDLRSGIDYIEYAVKDQQLTSERDKSRYNSRMLSLAIAVCVLTLIVVLILWRNWKLMRKTNELLRLQFRQLESTTNALEASNGNYARLIKMVAHDLRNPIGGIMSLSAVIRGEDLTPKQSQEFIGIIHESSNNCLTLISDLLKTDFEFKESELQKESIDLPDFLQQMVVLLAFRANEKNQQLILDETNSLTVNADRDKLLRVLSNLIVNAIKFSPEGEIIYIHAKPVEGGVVISIKDNGVGIPASDAARLFDPFTKVMKEGTAGEQPFGLGLYICKQILEAHHGKIWFESVAGNGTVFHVMLPDTELVAG